MKGVRILAVLFLAVLLGGCACAYPQDPPVPVPEASCTVEMLDVGQGLSLLVQMDGAYLLYDGGGRETSSYVVRHLRDLGITRIDLMVASHYDEDHISGLVGVLSTVDVERVIAPSYEADTKIYRSFRDKLGDSGAQALSPNPGEVYALGGGEVLVLGPDHEDCEIENDRSVVVLLTYGKFRCLITGDAESEAELRLTASGFDLSADLYVAGHHGSASSSSRSFLEAVRPRYVFISCGADNSYGHPAARTLDAFRDIGAEIFRTDCQGPVTAFTDGEVLWFSQDPCGDWTPGTREQEAGGEPAREGYVLNERTMRFHRPDCESVRKMKPENRIRSNASREDLIARGYRPCGSCSP